MWVSVKDRLPETGEYVLTKCDNFWGNGEVVVIVSKLMIDDEWYSFYPYDEPVHPTHWCYTLQLNDKINK